MKKFKKWITDWGEKVWSLSLLEMGIFWPTVVSSESKQIKQDRLAALNVYR